MVKTLHCTARKYLKKKKNPPVAESTDFTEELKNAEILTRAILERKYFDGRSRLKVTETYFGNCTVKGEKNKAREGNSGSCKTKKKKKKIHSSFPTISFPK